MLVGQSKDEKDAALASGMIWRHAKTKHPGEPCTHRCLRRRPWAAVRAIALREGWVRREQVSTPNTLHSFWWPGDVEPPTYAEILVARQQTA